jgi:hypothetical protein
MRIIVEYMNEHAYKIEEFEKEATVWSKTPFGSLALRSPAINLGGQIVSEALVLELIEDIEKGEVSSWNEVHQRYDEWDHSFEKTKAIKAYYTLSSLCKVSSDNPFPWKMLLDTFISLCDENARQIRITRDKDFHEVFRSSVYRNEEEKKAVLGVIEEDSFVISSREKMNHLIAIASGFSC